MYCTLYVQSIGSVTGKKGWENDIIPAFDFLLLFDHNCFGFYFASLFNFERVSRRSYIKG